MWSPRAGQATGVNLRGIKLHHARKPADIVADELWDHDDPETAAADIIDALEEAGWLLVYVPDTKVFLETLS